MVIKLKKQTIEILKVLKEKNADCEASDLANELNIDYIVLMAAINDLIDENLGTFKEDEVFQLSLNEESLSYIKNGLPERQLLNILIKRKIKEIEMPKCFSVKIRDDLIAKVIETQKIKQPYAPSPVAGKQHAAKGKIVHRRHVWRSGYGRGSSARYHWPQSHRSIHPDPHRPEPSPMTWRWARPG